MIKFINVRGSFQHELTLHSRCACTVVTTWWTTSGLSLCIALEPHDKTKQACIQVRSLGLLLYKKQSANTPSELLICVSILKPCHKNTKLEKHTNNNKQTQIILMNYSSALAQANSNHGSSLAGCNAFISSQAARHCCLLLILEVRHCFDS